MTSPLAGAITFYFSQIRRGGVHFHFPARGASRFLALPRVVIKVPVSCCWIAKHRISVNQSNSGLVAARRVHSQLSSCLSRGADYSPLGPLRGHPAAGGVQAASRVCQLVRPHLSPHPAAWPGLSSRCRFHFHHSQRRQRGPLRPQFRVTIKLHPPRSAGQSRSQDQPGFSGGKRALPFPGGAAAVEATTGRSEWGPLLQTVDLR